MIPKLSESVQPEPASPTPPPPEDLLAALIDISNSQDQTNSQLNRIAEALESIAGVVGAIGKRFGL